MITIVQTIGGIGIFLLGMIIMTDGLRALASKTLHAALIRFTRTPMSGATMGAISTGILQSSSATTVAVVGFVSVGLLSFPNALGIIFGANIGTTITGWLIALFGFKFKLGLFVLPLIFIGSILRLFTKDRLANTGLALAGFGLIFVGITVMQEGMSDLQSIINFDQIQDNTISSIFKLVVLGILFTIITQSSSAGVAAVLTALYAGVIGFEQAAALVIGMDIGTTSTALMATVGGSASTRRTGFSHVIYNLFTGTIALFLITPYTLIWEYISPGSLFLNVEIALVAFHTTFNMIGVILVLPFTRLFASLMEKLVPEKLPTLTRQLEASLLQHPTLALNSVQLVVHDEIFSLLAHINAILGNSKAGRKTNLAELQRALDDTHRYIDDIEVNKNEEVYWQRLINLIHTLDHLQRLHERCEEEEDRAITARESPELEKEQQLLIENNNKLIEAIKNKQWTVATHLAMQTKDHIHNKVKPYRDSIIQKIGSGEISVPEGTDYLEAIRWLKRVSNHIARITAHLESAMLPSSGT